LKDTVQPWQQAAAGGSVVDVEGHPFTKGLHLADKHGKPAVNPRTGKLIRLPKAQRDPSLVLEPPPAQLQTQAQPWEVPPVEEVKEAEPMQTEEEKQAGATANAEILVELWHLGAAVMFGPKESAFEVDPLTETSEDKKLYETGRRWLLATGRTHPGSALLMHLLHGARYVLRVLAKVRGVTVEVKQ
jgi:hypothetical protein